ncbi:hypothetical protein B0T14DRAFT_239715 [Immersiella caudata]|uniref:Rad60/SUMO-like domain-containing protein n=1 Tax=Immersiella caudata TaxID=314043 RepID=A0AA40C163_9PEZI|nr:hypothetical protein B0T14DRAFT_239715 [Immersiella caudata]
MAFAESEQGATTPKKKRALPFKRTVFQQPPASAPADSDPSKPEDNDIDFFRRPKDVFPIVAEERDERDTKKVLKSPDNYERKRRKMSSDSEDGVSWKKRSFGSDDDFLEKDKGEGKVKSFSLDDSDDDFPKKGTGKGQAKSFSPDDSDDDLIMDIKGKGKDIYSPAKAATSKKTATRTSKGKFVYEEDDDDFYSPPKRRPAASPIPTRDTRLGVRSANDYDTDESDLPETKPRIEDLDEDKSWKFDTTKPINLLDSDSDDELEVVERKPRVEDDSDDDLKEIDAPDPFNKWVRKAEELETQNQDISVKITVTSPLENARPIIVMRKMGQELGLILDTWVSTQIYKYDVEIAPDIVPSLFLTWKGKKVYKYTTPISLGVQLDANRKLICGDNDGYIQDALHLEVWTEEAYAEHLKQKEHERNLRLGLLDATDDAVDEERSPTQESEKKKGIKVILKAKELEPVKLKIYEDTTVQRLVDEFRTRRDIGPGQIVAIYFDGEKLGEGSLVVDADIDPDDTNQFEVHVR